jgi:hypothetical protein
VQVLPRIAGVPQFLNQSQANNAILHYFRVRFQNVFGRVVAFLLSGGQGRTAGAEHWQVLMPTPQNFLKQTGLVVDLTNERQPHMNKEVVCLDNLLLKLKIVRLCMLHRHLKYEI